VDSWPALDAGCRREGTLSEDRVERRLAAILAADVAGYSRLMGTDEEGTLAALRAIRRESVDPKIAEHRGRIVKTTGDGLLVEFPSVVGAVRCAVEMQRTIAEQNAAVPADQRIEFRIGVHQGDIIVEDGDIFGDGVNLAARLEGLAEPGGICVSGRVHADAAGKVDIAFKDLGEQSLKNIARPVRAFAARIGADPAAATTPSTPALALPEKPSIAVLPFQNLSGDPKQEYFVDGMVEEIITVLSRIRWLFVIARNSSFTYKGQAVDVKRVARELGVRYVLEGSVRKTGKRVRIAAQLIEAETDSHLWADRFDGSLEDVFDLQDRVASSVAGVIEPALQATEAARSARRPTADMTAYDLYLRADAMVGPSNREGPAALRLLEHAVALDPRYGPALAYAALCCSLLVADGRSDNPEEHYRTGIDFARRALEAANDDPGTLVNAAQALAYFGEDIGAMMGLVDRALALNPNFARGWRISGQLRNWAGQPDTAIEHIETSRRLNPRARVGGLSFNIGIALFFGRRFDEALPNLLLAVEEDPSQAGRYRFLAACYAHLGRVDEARAVARRLCAITPTVIPTGGFLRNPDQRELYLSGLRLAMDEAE
jgi:TolB-like protein